MTEGYIAEYGSIEEFRTIDLVRMYDGDGQMILCKCGNPATDSLIEKNCYMAKCSECEWEEK